MTAPPSSPSRTGGSGVPEPYYRDEWVTLYHGDFREVLASFGSLWMPGVIVTDPPYGIGWKRGNNTNRYSKPHDGIKGDEDTTLRDLALSLYPAVPAVVFGSFYAPPPRSGSTSAGLAQAR